jgi:hypothetical protein
MNNPVVSKSLFALVVLALVFAVPTSVLAQRGGHGGGGFHGGGGGFHGGGGSFHGGGYGGYHGGGSSHAYGAYHGGNYYGGHGGYYGRGGYYRAGYYGGHGYGWGGGYWGYPGWGFGFGWGWGFGLSVSFGGYPGYPYGYGYAPPYYPYAYPYPYYGVPSGAANNYPSSYAPNTSESSSYEGEDYASAQQSSASVQQQVPAPSAPRMQYASYAATPNHAYAAAGQPNAARFAVQQPVRPEVQVVIRALRGMPPEARQRQVDSGRYGNLSAQELEFAMYAAELPPARVQGPPR